MRPIDADELESKGIQMETHGGATFIALGSVRTAPTIDPESLRPKGHWNIRCESHHDTWTGETDEEFYLECSECRRKVWDINQMAAMNGDYRKLIADFPYCHCGAKMEE